jgi:hypothetical protein
MIEKVRKIEGRERQERELAIRTERKMKLKTDMKSEAQKVKIFIESNALELATLEIFEAGKG